MNRILLLIVLCALAFLAGYGTGQRAEHNANEANKLRAVEGRIERHNTAAVAGNAAEGQAAARAQTTEKHFQVIRQKEIVYVQNQAGATGCGLDADGLRLWRDANAGADPVAAGAPDAAMPGTAAADERSADRSALQPPHDGAAAAPVPGSSAGAGRMDGGR